MEIVFLMSLIPYVHMTVMSKQDTFTQVLFHS